MRRFRGKILEILPILGRIILEILLWKNKKIRKIILEITAKTLSVKIFLINFRVMGFSVLQSGRI